jgi:uncharacterized protein DUF5681
VGRTQPTPTDPPGAPPFVSIMPFRSATGDFLESAFEQREKKIGKPFHKGQSGNPGGRPKVLAEIKEIAREHTAEQFRRWCR